LKIYIKISPFLLSFLLLISCQNDFTYHPYIDLIQSPFTADENSQKVLMPKIEFNQDLFDFGEMKQKETYNAEFRFKNIGDAPLLIRSVQTSCGCLVSNWPKEPIAPGSNAIISVVFYSENLVGKQNKKVILVTNSIPSILVLTLKGIVLSSKK
jgi:hypothetical protein